MVYEEGEEYGAVTAQDLLQGSNTRLSLDQKVFSWFKIDQRFDAYVKVNQRL